jgi:DNA-binding response OmpR family regulator
MARILVVDDDPICTQLLGAFLSRDGHEVRCALSGREAVEVGGDFHADLLVTDWLLDDRDGIAVVEALQAANPEMRTIFITATMSTVLRNLAKGLPVLAVLEKPLDIQELFAKIREALGALPHPSAAESHP